MTALKTGFSLSPQLETDTFAVSDLRLSTVRLMNDARYPWVVLVPRVADAKEIFDLNRTEQHFLMEEIAATARAMQNITKPTKMNVGALGNVVRQLHVHVIARFDVDATWPGPVWGKGAAKPYSDEGEAFISLLRPQIAEEMARK